MPNQKINTQDLATPMLLLMLAVWCSLFDVVNASPSYEYLRPIGNIGWACIFGTLGAAKAVSIIYDLYLLRRALILICIALWTTLAAIIIYTNHASPATPACLYFVYQLALVFHRLRRPERSKNGN